MIVSSCIRYRGINHSYRQEVVLIPPQMLMNSDPLAKESITPIVRRSSWFHQSREMFWLV